MDNVNTKNLILGMRSSSVLILVLMDNVNTSCSDNNFIDGIDGLNPCFNG